MQNRENSGFINNGFMSNAGISHSLESRCEVEGNNQKFLKFLYTEFCAAALSAALRKTSPQHPIPH